MSVYMKGENNPNWLGDKAGYYALHSWIEKEKGKARDHRCSLADNTCSGKMNWSNKSNKYKRDLKDWWVLCISHHKRFDMTDKIRDNMRQARINYLNRQK